MLNRIDGNSGAGVYGVWLDALLGPNYHDHINDKDNENEDNGEDNEDKDTRYYN